MKDYYLSSREICAKIFVAKGRLRWRSAVNSNGPRCCLFHRMLGLFAMGQDELIWLCLREWLGFLTS